MITPSTVRPAPPGINMQADTARETEKQAPPMIEQVARALARHGHREGESWWPAYTDAARVAIEAMREPTEDMKRAGWRAIPEHDFGNVAAASVWDAMIDEALQ